MILSVAGRLCDDEGLHGPDLTARPAACTFPHAAPHGEAHTSAAARLPWLAAAIRPPCSQSLPRFQAPALHHDHRITTHTTYTHVAAAQEGREGTGGNGNGDADSPRGGTTSTHLSPSMLGGTAAGAAAAGADHNLAGGHHHHGDGGGAECAAAAADLSDRNRSISSAHRGAQHAGLMGGGGQPGLRQPQPGLVPGGLSHFTAGFPPGPQQQLLAQLPWFAQLQVRSAGRDTCCEGLI